MTRSLPKTSELDSESGGTLQTATQTMYEWTPSAEMKTDALCHQQSPCKDGEVGSKEMFERKDLAWREITGLVVDKQVDLWREDMVGELGLVDESFKV